MKEISNEQFINRRDLYHAKDLRLTNIEFKSSDFALKEASNVSLDSCLIAAKNVLWHANKANVFKTNITEEAKDFLWYGLDINISKTQILAHRVLRESQKISLSNSKIEGLEFSFRCFNILGNNLDINSNNAFFENRSVTLNNSKFKGEYLFAYNQDLLIMNSEIIGNDALWHTKATLIKDSVIKGDHIGWYSKNLTIMNSKIIGEEPFAYCEDLKLVDCVMENASNSFEYSSVDADVYSHIDSILNPRSGNIIASSVGKIIKTDDAIYESIANIKIREKE